MDSLLKILVFLRRFSILFILLLLILLPLSFVFTFTGYYTSYRVYISYDEAKEFCISNYRTVYIDKILNDSIPQSRFMASVGSPRDSVPVFFWPVSRYAYNIITVRGFYMQDGSREERRAIRRAHETFENMILKSFPGNPSWQRSNYDLWLFFFFSFINPWAHAPGSYIIYIFIAFLISLWFWNPKKKGV